MDKHKELDHIAREIQQCRLCRKGGTGMAAAGEGNADAPAMFVGEAPGKEEAKAGRPFIGRSGKFLRETIAHSGLREDEIFITSPVHYLPLSGTPSPEAIAHGRIHLMK